MDQSSLDSGVLLKDIDGTPYGHALKSKYFNLEPQYCNLNHGSFGTVAKPVSYAQYQLQLDQEARSDRWFRDTYFKHIDHAREAIAGLVNANSEDIVLLENASSAINSILRTIGLQKGDKILRLSNAYPMVIHTLNWLVSTVGIEVVVVNVEYPVKGPEQLVDAVSDALKANAGIKLCIFSHIASIPTLIEPVELLTPLAQSHNSLVILDGAHCPGVLDLDLKALNPDFYLGNLHKWIFAPKGTAFMYVRNTPQRELVPQPTVISSTGENEYLNRFKYTGTRDYTGFTAIPAAVTFLQTLGGLKQIQQYNHSLAVSAANYLASVWKTHLMVPESMCGFMINVVLPSSDWDALNAVQVKLDKEYDIFCVFASVENIKAANPDGSGVGSSSMIYFTRLSAQVYLEMSDFEQLGTLVPQLLEEYYASKNKQ